LDPTAHLGLPWKIYVSLDYIAQLQLQASLVLLVTIVQKGLLHVCHALLEATASTQKLLQHVQQGIYVQDHIMRHDALREEYARMAQQIHNVKLGSTVLLDQV
jgi:hypothetical protein